MTVRRVLSVRAWAGSRGNVVPKMRSDIP
jgi:hypothetical protein